MGHRLLFLACALAPALALAEGAATSTPTPTATATATENPTTTGGAMASEPAADVPPPSDLPAPPPAPSEAPYPRFGFSVGGGVPQAATADFLFRPRPWLRLAAGPSWDYVGWGIHGGASVAPFRGFVTPTLGVEAGWLFDADLNKITSVDPDLQPLLRQVGLTYLSATAGLELGSQRGFAFSIRAGLAWFQGTMSGTGTLQGTGGISGQNDAVVTVTNPRIRASTPTVQLAVQYFLH